MPLTSETMNAHRDAPEMFCTRFPRPCPTGNPYDDALVDHPTPPREKEPPPPVLPTHPKADP